MGILDDVAASAASGQLIHHHDLPLMGTEAEERFKDSMASEGGASFPTEHMVTASGHGGAPTIETAGAERNGPHAATLASMHYPARPDGSAASELGVPGQAVTLQRRSLSVHAEATLMSHPRHPFNPRLSTNPSDRAQAELDRMAADPTAIPPEQQSQFNGYKYRDPDLQQGVANFLAIPGVRNDPHHSMTEDPANRLEKAQISHRVPGQLHLQPGQTFEGEPDEVANPEEYLPTARTDGHTHVPEPGLYGNFDPSAADQLTARLNQHVRSFVKVPDFHKSHGDNVLVYSGAQPLRHYISLPNDGSHRVDPDSPDSYSPGGTHFTMPPFKHPPPDYPGQTRPPGPRDDNSLSGSEADEADLMAEDDDGE